MAVCPSSRHLPASGVSLTLAFIGLVHGMDNQIKFESCHLDWRIILVPC